MTRQYDSRSCLPPRATAARPGSRSPREPEQGSYGTLKPPSGPPEYTVSAPQGFLSRLRSTDVRSARARTTSYRRGGRGGPKPRTFRDLPRPARGGR